jgi:hypothetical protein
MVLLLAWTASSFADGDPVAMDLWRVEKVTNEVEQWVEYQYSLDYQHDFGHTGPIYDWHVHLGEWTPGQITITPPENWAGSWQGGTYGCETNENPYYFGNMYTGNWKIRVKWGYGDGTATYTFTDQLHNEVGWQDGVLIPQLPEPSCLLLLALGGLGMVYRRRMLRGG